MVPPSTPSILGVGQIVVTAGKCGPLVAVEHDDVHGVVLGYFHTGTVDLGQTDRVVPFRDAAGHIQQWNKEPRMDGVDGYDLYGDQVTLVSSVLGVAGAKNLALGGGTGNGSWGQGGAGQSSSMQRLVSQVQIVPCLYAEVAVKHVFETSPITLTTGTITLTTGTSREIPSAAVSRSAK